MTTTDTPKADEAPDAGTARWDEVIAQAAKSVPPEVLERATNSMMRVIIESAINKFNTLPIEDRRLHVFEYSEAAENILQDLAGRMRDSRENVLLKALILYRTAAEAAEEGNRLAILNRDDEIVREITGFGAADLSPAEHATGPSTD